MPEWLRDAATTDSVPIDAMALRLGLAVVAGVVVAAFYWYTRRPGRSGVPLVATLVLLTVMIALVTLAIGNSVARAFSLVGALSIVRFRTVVEDARDTAFVIFAVAVGMAIGTGFVAGALVGVPIIGAAAWAVAAWERRAVPAAAEGVLQLRVGLGHEPAKILAEVVGRYLDSVELISALTARQGSALELTYRVRYRGKPDVVTLIGTLNRCEGVQGVEIRQA